MSDFIQFSDKGLKQAGVQTGMRDYSDQYQEAAMSQYNNAYNYWLWQQQAQYNSPEQQVVRLKAAGLNPNYNSIEGAGNLKDTPVSKADIHSNLSEQSISKTNQLLNVVNSVLNGIKEGVQTVSQISAIPDNIGLYRQYLRENLRGTVDGKNLDNYLKEIEGASKAFEYLGIETPYINQPAGVGYDAFSHYRYGRELAENPRQGAVSVFTADAPHFQSLKLKNAFQSLMNEGAKIIPQLREGQVKINEQNLLNLKKNWELLDADAEFRRWLNSGKAMSEFARVIGAFIR